MEVYKASLGHWRQNKLGKMDDSEGRSMSGQRKREREKMGQKKQGKRKVNKEKRKKVIKIL